MSDFEHVMISRAELAKIILEAKGFDPEKTELVNMEFQSTQLQQVLPLFLGPWTDQACPFDLFAFGVRGKDDSDSIPVQPSQDEGTV